MTRKKRMSTWWEVPEDLWEGVVQLLEEYDPPKTTGRKREDSRRVLDGLIFGFRTGCQWNHIPSVYGDGSTPHRTFQRWQQLGLFEKIWALWVEQCEALGQVDWRGQAADTAMGKARGAATAGVHTQPIGPKTAPNEVFSLREAEGR